jgi:hypothetical protein
MPTKRIIATFNTPNEAYFAKMILEASGIASSLFDENLISIQPLYSIAVGGVKLAVSESQVAEAIGIIGEYETQQMEHEEDNCPKCSSTNTRKTFRFSLFIIPFILISFAVFGMATIGLVYLISLYSKYKCQACGHGW